MVYAQIRICKILWNFKIQTDLPIPDLELNNKKKRTFHLVDFAVSMEHIVKKKCKDCQILGSCQRTEKAGKYEGDSYTYCS